jgi:hypothetical protein
MFLTLEADRDCFLPCIYFLCNTEVKKIATEIRSKFDKLFNEYTEKEASKSAKEVPAKRKGEAAEGESRP